MLEPLLTGTQLTGGRIRHRSGLILGGWKVAAVEAVGKHLLITFADGRCLRVHLGMYGSWHRYASGEAWRKPAHRAGVVLEFNDTVLVCFDPREVGFAGAGPASLRDRVGPDLLGQPPPDWDDVTARARQLPPESLLVDLLLDQRVAAGVGNVYKSELLFLEGLAPVRTLGATPDEALQRLYRRAATLLRRNTREGSRTTRFENDGRSRLWVYGRRDLPCLRCGSTIQHGPEGRHARITYWCPACQHHRPGAGHEPSRYRTGQLSQ